MLPNVLCSAAGKSPGVSVVAVADSSPGVCVGVCSAARSRAEEGGEGWAGPGEPRLAMGTSRDLSPERRDECPCHVWAIARVTSVTLVLSGGTCSLGSCSPPLRSAASSFSLSALLLAAAAPVFSPLGLFAINMHQEAQGFVPCGRSSHDLNTLVLHCCKSQQAL